MLKQQVGRKNVENGTQRCPGRHVNVRWGMAALVPFVLCSAVNASVIYGLNIRGDNFIFQTTTTDFVGDFTQVGGVQTYDSFAMDMDLSATTLWATLFDGGLNTYGTVDLTTGNFTALGTLSGLGGSDNVTGMSVDPTSGDWYLTAIGGGLENLYRGDITTGTFALVGALGFDLNIDLAINSKGEAYGHDIASDQLLSIDLLTGLATAIGPTGIGANFAQGMDFDYADDTLYASLYTGSGTGVFATFNLDTGFATVLQSTTPLNAEMEIVVATAIPGPGAIVLLALGGLVGASRKRKDK